MLSSALESFTTPHRGPFHSLPFALVLGTLDARSFIRPMVERKEMERVLFVVNADEFGGLEIVLLDWLSGIEYSKVSAALCYRAEVLKERLAARSLPVETIKLNAPDHEPGWKAFWRWRRIFSSIRAHKIVLMEGNFGDFGLTPVLAARLSTKRNVFLFAGGGGTAISANIAISQRKLHFGFLPGIGWYRYKEIFRQRLRSFLLQRSFVSSQELKDNLTACFGLPAGRLSVLYHGLDTARFQPSPAERAEYRRVTGIPDDAIVIVSHGRLAPVKRVDRILKAFALLSAEHPNIWLLITSYGPLKDEVERTVASSDAYRRVKLVGFQEDASRLLKAADIYVLASDREGFGIALIEAMSSGLVCVATNCYGPAGILVNGENGILVEATDADVLAGLRRALLLSAEEGRRLAAQARKTVEERFEIHAALRRALDSLGIPNR
jgi:glycosyltransferase involved in cell wall biosynthesis